MGGPYTLFEISWEVCNMVGGIHTVLSTKARTSVQELGDDYVAVGPWVLSDAERAIAEARVNAARFIFMSPETIVNTL